MPTNQTPEDEPPWIALDSNTQTYRTRDGTVTPAELVDSADCLADVLRVASMRAEHRAAIAATKRGGA